ncbi:MAG: hypothetical protein DYH12_31050, partial [Sorangiineae bacterium PRO1]|nr:hypothetical protein [Sorangiineae bacterium PRO1]
MGIFAESSASSRRNSSTCEGSLGGLTARVDGGGAATGDEPTSAAMGDEISGAETDGDEGSAGSASRVETAMGGGGGGA